MKRVGECEQIYVYMCGLSRALQIRNASAKTKCFILTELLFLWVWGVFQRVVAQFWLADGRVLINQRFVWGSPQVYGVHVCTFLIKDVQSLYLVCACVCVQGWLDTIPARTCVCGTALQRCALAGTVMWTPILTCCSRRSRVAAVLRDSRGCVSAVCHISQLWYRITSVELHHKHWIQGKQALDLHF